MAESDEIGEDLKVHLPYACPTCGHSVVFKRILTVDEAAYVAGTTESAIRLLFRKRRLRFKYLTNGGSKIKPIRMVDSVDLLEYLRTKYQYPEEIDPTTRSGKYIERQTRRGLNVTATWNRNRAARKAARLAQELSDRTETDNQTQEGPEAQLSDSRDSIE